MPKKRISINGSKWEIEDAVLEGVCNYDLRCISIDKRIRRNTKKRLTVEMHEVLHALSPDSSEETVDSISTRLAKIMWELGWRQKTDK